MPLHGTRRGMKIGCGLLILYILSAKGKRSYFFVVIPSRFRLTWVDEKHHTVLPLSGARGSRFYLILYPLLRKEMIIAMELILETCCGVDVHKKTIMACLMVGKADEKPHKNVKTFSTMTGDLLACKDWLEPEGCITVAMETSDVCWKPVCNIIEMCPDETPILRTVNGLPSSFAKALFRTVLGLSVNPVILPGIAVNLSTLSPQSSIPSTRCWKMPLSALLTLE